MTDIKTLAKLIQLTGIPLPSTIILATTLKAATIAAQKAKNAAPEIIIRNSSSTKFEKLLKFIAALDAIYEEGIKDPEIQQLGKIPFFVKTLCEKLEISQSTCWRLMQHPATQKIFKIERGKWCSYLVRVTDTKDPSKNNEHN